MKSFYITTLLLLSTLSYCQVLITDGHNAQPTSESEIILELKSMNANKGLILPRLPLQSIASPQPLTNHVAGMLVYNTANSGTAADYIYPGLYYNNGQQWLRLRSNNKPDVGDIKYSAMNSDHDGWYLLNGRNISTLGSDAAQNAGSLGFLTNLPDMSNRFLKAKASSETSGSTGGNTNIVLSQAHLPNVSFTGTTNSTGSHTHSYNDRANGVATGEEVNNVPRVDDLTTSSKTTSTAGAHTHTFSVPTGGTSQPIVFMPTYLSSYVFVYLGS